MKKDHNIFEEDYSWQLCVIGFSSEVPGLQKWTCHRRVMDMSQTGYGYHGIFRFKATIGLYS
jgi:hypothetical protein